MNPVALTKKIFPLILTKPISARESKTWGTGLSITQKQSVTTNHKPIHTSQTSGGHSMRILWAGIVSFTRESILMLYPIACMLLFSFLYLLVFIQLRLFGVKTFR